MNKTAQVNKVASSTIHLQLGGVVKLTEWVPATPGTVVVGRILQDKSTYHHIEDCHGRMVALHRGDVVVGVLGSRRALRGYAGVVPEAVLVGDVLQILNLGGVIGACTSVNPSLGPPFDVEILGGVAGDHGQSLNISAGPVSLDATLTARVPPVVWVAGSCMHAGKTAATCALVKGFTASGLRVGVAKVSGVALRRDCLEMLDHGAVSAYTFTDAGLPSTCDGDVVAAARGCLNALCRDVVDLIVVELGDGIMGDYGVMQILEDAELRRAQGALVFAASDPVAAWGGVEYLRRHGLLVDVVTGPATDNDAGSSAVERILGLPAVNARQSAEKLAAAVKACLRRTSRRAA